MKTKPLFHITAVFALLSAVVCQSYAAPVGTAFTYQGRLDVGTNAAKGTFDLTFALYDALDYGSIVGTPQTNLGVAISDGLFTVVLDFGNESFSGTARWLEMGVRSNGSGGAFTQLLPRQELTPAPYALYAASAGTAAQANSVAGGQVVKSLNGLADAVTLAAGSNVTLTAVGNALTIASTPDPQGTLPAGMIVLSQTTDNPALAAAGMAALIDWRLAKAQATWVARSSFPAVSYAGRLWVMGGTVSNGRTNDVWYSHDGLDWFQATNAADWGARGAHSALVFGDRIWVMGGSVSSGRTNDVWYSADGTNFLQATSAAPWAPRSSAAAVVLNDQMWLMGGACGSAVALRTNDVWSSADGTNWTLVTSNPPWVGRNGHKTVVFNGRIWVVGGATSAGVLTNDVWSSADGLNWTPATFAAPWAPRYNHELQVFAGQMLLLGGYSDTGVMCNDVWFSLNGTNWTQFTASAPWPSRQGFASAVHNNQLWIMGGNYSLSYSTNDVWSATIPMSGSFYLFQKF